MNDYNISNYEKYLIKNKKDCSKLLHALESAQKQKSVPVEFSRSYSLATKEEIDKIFI